MKIKIIVVSVLLLLVAAFVFGCVKIPISPPLPGLPQAEPIEQRCPLFINEGAQFLTDIQVTPLNVEVDYLSDENHEEMPIFSVASNQSYSLKVDFSLTDNTTTLFFKVLRCGNQSFPELYRIALLPSQLSVGQNSITVNLPAPEQAGMNEASVYMIRVVGVAGHINAQDWNTSFNDGLFGGRTPEELSWGDFEGAYQLAVKIGGEPHNPFMLNLSLTPSKTSLTPGESFTVEARYYRTYFCPSDYFKFLARNEQTGEITELGRWAAPYWEMVSTGWQTFSKTLTAPSTSGTYTLKAVGCSGHGTYNYFGVDWNDPRSDGGFSGHRPEEMSWDFYEIAEEFTITISVVVIPIIESFPKGIGYKCPDYLKPKDGDINGDGRSDWFYESLPDDFDHSIELWGVDPNWWPFDEFFAVMFSDETGKYFIGKCPFGGGQNTGYIEHFGDLDNNGRPDKITKAIWRSEDGGFDDPGSAPGRDAWEYIYEVTTRMLTKTHYDSNANVLSQSIQSPEKWQTPGNFNDLEPIIPDFRWDWDKNYSMTVYPAINIDFDPDTLNLKSQGKWVTVYIELPEGYDVNDIDVNTVKLNGLIPAELAPTEVGDYDEDGIPDLMVKFDRAAVSKLFSGLEVLGEYSVEVTGELTVPVVSFVGRDIIIVISQP